MVRLLIIISLITCQWSISVAQSQATSQREYDLLFMEAMVQRQKGQSDAAFDLLNRCRELNPQASETYFFLAQYYSHMKQQAKASCVIYI